MADDDLAEIGHHAGAALEALRAFTEQMTALALAAAGEARSVATDPGRVLGQIRRGAEEVVDLGTAWIEPVRKLSEEQRRFAEQMATWAERHRKFAEEVESWAETQRAFADHLSSWAEPLLTYSEQAGATLKGLIGTTTPTPSE